jgi:hypothetical protein
VQDPTVESAKKWKKISFGLLELEMADLEHFGRKTPLGPSRINIYLGSLCEEKYFFSIFSFK